MYFIKADIADLFIKIENDSDIPGCPSHSTSIGVALFVSPIFWYLSFSVSALRPCQGKLPLRKYINICPRASKSSRRLCSATLKLHNVIVGGKARGKEATRKTKM
jgi:hypothetical protein